MDVRFQGGTRGACRLEVHKGGQLGHLCRYIVLIPTFHNFCCLDPSRDVIKTVQSCPYKEASIEAEDALTNVSGGIM